MTTAWMDRQLYFQPPVAPRIVGLAIRAVDPARPDHDDGRRWVHEGRDRWMLHRNGAWKFTAVLGELGAAQITHFRCPVRGCGYVETTREKMLDGYCSKCNAQTGLPT